MCTGIWPGAFVWRTDIDIKCLHQLLSTYNWGKSSLNPELIFGVASFIQGSPCFSFLSLGWQTGGFPDNPGFYVDSREMKFSFYVCTTNIFFQRAISHVLWSKGSLMLDDFYKWFKNFTNCSLNKNANTDENTHT